MVSRRVLVGSATLLLAAVVGLGIVDNARDWKRLQRQFQELERRHLDAELGAARERAAEPLAVLAEEIESHQLRLAERRDEVDQLEGDLEGFRAKLLAASWRRDRLRVELERTAAADGEREGDELAEELRQARIEVESLEELIADRARKLAAVFSELDAARERHAAESAPIAALERRLAELGGGPFPGVEVHEVSVTDFPADDGSTRLDRCQTCHLGAPREDTPPDWPAPFGAHPRPELFVAAGSPHPQDRFGCTVCHGGAGRSTDFTRAGHQPSNPDQAAAWADAWGWRPAASPVRAMLPLGLTEASCQRCHGAEVWTPEAPVLDAGRRLIAALGCSGCHADAGGRIENRPAAGPSLRGIAGKTRRAWVYRWLEAPRDFRPTTMPHFFDLPEGAGETDRERRTAEILSLVHTLWDRSRPADRPPAPSGDVENGRALFDRVGCRGCHLIDVAEPAAGVERRFGPHLVGTGSKVLAQWLYAWLLDPRAYRHDTPMPSLRLDEDEAADLTAFLMSRRDPAWEDLRLPALPTAARDALVLSHLEQTHTVEASQARLERMSERERNSFLGERTIARYGCHGCHEIAGFEDAPALASAPESGQRGLPPSHRPAYALSEPEGVAVAVAWLALADAGQATLDPRTATLAAGREVVLRYNCRGCHRIEGRGPALDGDGEAAPDLTHAGARLQSPWLFDYLADPGRVTVRPWLAARMPSFSLTDAENNALVRYFAALDGRDLFSSPRPGPLGGEVSDKVDAAVGKVVHSMLQCGECHLNASAPESDSTPDYHLASERLRPAWVVDWILDPESWRPGTAMPAAFLGADGTLDSSFLIGSIGTPIFAPERDRLRRLFKTEEALHAYLSDPEQVAVALRAYLFSLD